MTFNPLTKLMHRLRRTSAPTGSGSADQSISPDTAIPTELILHIFTLAASDPQSGQAALASFAQLCSATQSWAETRLYASPTIASIAQLSRLTKTLKKSPRLAALVVKVTLNGSSAGKDTRPNVTASLPSLSQVAKSLRHLEICNAAIYSLMDFAGAEQLTHLTITNATLADRTSTFHRLAAQPSFGRLSSLTSLTLDNVSFLPSTASKFFSHTLTPTLRRLELRGSCTLEGAASPKRSFCEIKSVELLAGLEELVLGHGNDESEEELEERRAAVGRMLARAQNLKTLELATELVELDDLVNTLPRSLELLKFARDRGEEQEGCAPHLAARDRGVRKVTNSCRARGITLELA